jgi:hypothetical protein
MICCWLSYFLDVIVYLVNLLILIKPMGIFFHLNFDAFLNFVCYSMLMVIQKII